MTSQRIHFQPPLSLPVPLPDGDDDSSSSSPQGSAVTTTGGGAAWHNNEEQQLSAEVERLRLRPEEYVEELVARRNNIIGSSLWGRDGAARLVEGPGVVDEAIQAVKAYAASLRDGSRKSPPLPVALSTALGFAAQDLAGDVGPKGLLAQRGTDDSSVVERVERYANWAPGRLYEIAVFGSRYPTDVICQILLNDGVPSRVHRNLLLDGSLTTLGVCIAPHLTMAAVTVLVLSEPTLKELDLPVMQQRRRQQMAQQPPPLGSCAYCFAACANTRCVYGLEGRQYHAKCFMCKVCKSALRGTYYANEGHVFCRDCVLFRHPPKCHQCRKPVPPAQSTSQYFQGLQAPVVTPPAGAAPAATSTRPPKQSTTKDSSPSSSSELLPFEQSKALHSDENLKLLCEECFLDKALSLAEGYVHDRALAAKPDDAEEE